MKIGNLVKIKCFPYSRFKNKMHKDELMGQLGIVVEAAENVCKVLFPTRNGIIKNCMKNNLEVISE